MLSTGADDKFSKQGIYDLAGNVWEYTLEFSFSSDYPCAIRGGCYYYDGNAFTATKRAESNLNVHDKGIGFRLALY